MRLPQLVLSSSPKTSMSLCDEFKSLEQSKTDPKKRQRLELSGEASHGVGRSLSPILSRGQGMYRKGRVPQPPRRPEAPRSGPSGCLASRPVLAPGTVVSRSWTVLRARAAALGPRPFPVS